MYLGVSTSPGHVPVLLFPIVVGVLCWATIATAVSGLIPHHAATCPVLTATCLALVASGAIGTPSGEPSWLRTVADYLPVHPVIETSDAALRGSWPIWSVAQFSVVMGRAGAAAAVADVQRATQRRAVPGAPRARPQAAPAHVTMARAWLLDRLDPERHAS